MNHGQSLLRISEAASLAIHTMCLLAKQTDRVSTQDIAEALHASENHLAKVMQRMVKSGLVHSTRGPSGGFTLARPAGEILLMEIYECVEGPLGPAGCLLGMPACEEHHCPLGSMAISVHNKVRDYFANTTLERLAKGVRLGETSCKHEK